MADLNKLYAAAVRIGIDPTTGQALSGSRSKAGNKKMNLVSRLHYNAARKSELDRDKELLEEACLALQAYEWAWKQLSPELREFVLKEAQPWVRAAITPRQRERAGEGNG